MTVFAFPCPACGERCLWSDRFCGACGAGLEARVVAAPPALAAYRAARAPGTPKRRNGVAPGLTTLVALAILLGTFGGAWLAVRTKAGSAPDQAIAEAPTLPAAPGDLAPTAEPPTAAPTRVPTSAPTAVPRRTPTPWATEAPDLTAAGLDYLVAVGDVADRLPDSLERAAALFGNPRLYDAEWIEDIAWEMALWKGWYEDALFMSVPPRFTTVHGKYVTMLGLLDGAVDDIVYGLDHYDFDSLDDANRKVDRFGTALAEWVETLSDELGIDATESDSVL